MAKSCTTSHLVDEQETRGRPGYYDFHALTPPPQAFLTRHTRTWSFPSTIASSTTSAVSSAPKRVASWLTPSIKPASPKVNVHTTCGRHSDQMLFGGPSLTDVARSIFRKNK